MSVYYDDLDYLIEMGDKVLDLIISFILIITIMMWFDLIMCFISTTFIDAIIIELQKQKLRIKKERNEIKKLFNKVNKKNCDR